MTFRVGMKVVCVDAGPSRNDGVSVQLVEHAIYEIAGFDAHPERGVFLAGIAPLYVYLPDMSPIGWDQRRFRPLVETKSDISFTVGAPKDSEHWDNRKVKVS